VPAYAIFTNEQLAEIVQRKLRTASALGEIEGVGKARVDKYGALFLALLGRVLGSAANGGRYPRRPPHLRRTSPPHEAPGGEPW
jgi:ribonuclease D